MKKSYFFVLCSFVVAILFMSCATLPKTVKPGDTLVIGRVEIKAHDYALYNGYEMNGTFHSDVELELTEQSSGKKRNIKPNKDGCFYIKGLKPECTYGFTKATYKVNHSNGYAYCWVEIPEPRWFTPIDNKVINIGCTYYDFDGSKHLVSWNTTNHFYVRQFFEDIDEESEWFEKDVIDLRK